jgi:hypothetical protein
MKDTRKEYRKEDGRREGTKGINRMKKEKSKG